MQETITITVNEEKLEIPVPNGFSLRKSNPNCAKRGCMCAVLNGSLVCCRMELKQKPNGEFSLFELNPCSKGNGKIEI